MIRRQKSPVPFMVVVVAFLFYCAFSSPTITDKDWVAFGLAQHIVGNVASITYDNGGTLYIGGRFNIPGQETITNIARWDGHAWRAVGDSIGDISSIVIDGSNNLYIGGSFKKNSPQGVIHNIAKWVGTGWSPLGNGINGKVRSLFIDKTDMLYAGGAFDSAGNVSASNVAKWDGAKWSGLGTGIAYHSYECAANDVPVMTLATDTSGNLYAAGCFDSAGSVSVRNIACWNGASWSALGAGINRSVRSIAVDRNNVLYIGGGRDIHGTDSMSSMLQWNGKEWSKVGDGVKGYIRSIIIDPTGNVYAGGESAAFGLETAGTIAQWDGVKWLRLGIGVVGWVNAVANNKSGGIVAAGSFKIGENDSTTGIAKWDGREWVTFGTEIDTFLDGTIASLVIDRSGVIYAGGRFSTYGSTPLSSVIRWDGTGWNSVGEDIAWHGVTALAINNAGTLFASGLCDSAIEGAPRIIGQGFGSTWNVIERGHPNTSYINIMECDRKGDLYVGGSFNGIAGISASNIVRWNGQTWQSLGSGINENTMIRCIAFDSMNNLYAGGFFDTAGSVIAHGIARWDGKTWSPLGTGFRSGISKVVNSIAIDRSNNIYAGGGFDSAGTVAARRIARWDGIRWSPLGAGINGLVDVVSVDNEGNLYAGGQFDSAGSVTAKNIARWDGNAWCAMGTGVGGGGVSYLINDQNNNLFVGGPFRTAGGKTSPGFALCKLPAATREATGGNSNRSTTFLSNNSKGQVVLHLAAPVVVSVRLFDCSGRKVHSFTAMMSAGRQTLPIAVSGIVNGMYLVQVEAGTTSMLRTILVTR